MTSAVPPPGVSIADARLEEVSDGIYAYLQPDGSGCLDSTTVSPSNDMLVNLAQ